VKGFAGAGGGKKINKVIKLKVYKVLSLKFSALINFLLYNF